MDRQHRRFTSSTRGNYYFAKFKKRGHLHTITPNLAYFEGKPTAKAMRSLFKSIFRHLLKDTKEDDWVQLHLEADSLSNQNLNTPWVRQREFTLDFFMGQVEATLQSQTTFCLAGEFVIELKHVEARGAKGQGRTNRPHNRGVKRYLDTRRLTYLDPADFAPEGLCVPAAIVYALAFQKADNTKRFRRNALRPTFKAELVAETWRLCYKAKVSTAKLKEVGCLYKQFKKLDVALGPEVGLRVYNSLEDPDLSYDTDKTGKGPLTYVNVFQDGEHCRAIKDVERHVNRRHFCEACQIGFKSFHLCRNACKWCGKPEGCVWQDVDQLLACPVCHISGFRGPACLAFHRQKLSGHVHTRCEARTCCKTCKRVVFLSGKATHACEKFVCKICRQHFPLEEMTDHVCFLQTQVEVKDVARPLVFWDTEATQDSLDAKGHAKHKVNMACALRFCKAHAGIHVPSDPACPDCGPVSFKTMGQFFKWVFEDLANRNALCLAHNFGGYDGGFLQEWMATEGLKADNLLVRGNKLLSLKAAGVEFKDSLNFLPIALAAFPASFGIQERKKGFFPYLFNREEHAAYVGPLPPVETFGQGAQRPGFQEWYAERALTPWDHAKELHEYCASDVTLLAEGCLSFRLEYFQLAGFDPFKSCVTLPSACMLDFRLNHLRENTIAMIPPGLRLNHLSGAGAVWLEHEGKKLASPLRTGHNRWNGREARLVAGDKTYFVDGFCQELNTVYEFNGCAWHGCPKCTDPEGQVPKRNIPNQAAFDLQQGKQAALKAAGFKVVSLWEHDFLAKAEKQKFLQHIKEPLQPREAFYGGRTNATCLLKEVSGEHSIRYVDVTSLYPYVQKSQDFPVGVPELLLSPELKPGFRGLIKATVLPPRDLFHPVLPYRVDQKLLFPLCRTCAEAQNQRTACTHPPCKRRLTGTWCTPEFYRALELGYTVHRIQEVWHWEEWDNMFAGYVNKWAKVKAEANGWPARVRTEEEKQAYVAEVLAHDGIQLDPANIQKNPGKKFVAKRALNSQWGKFGQRDGQKRREHVRSYDHMLKLLDDPQKRVVDMTNMGPSILQIEWEPTEEAFGCGATNNVVYAAFTTCYARLHLYAYLDTLDGPRAPQKQRRVLYYDTDSLFYWDRPEWDSLPVGPNLGDLKDEVVEDGFSHVTRFVSGGPKNYAYTGPGDLHVHKARGFNLAHAGPDVNFEALKKMVGQFLAEEEGETHDITAPFHVYRGKTGEGISSGSQTKKYRLVYTKRRVHQTGHDPDGEEHYTYPYGYVTPRH